MRGVAANGPEIRSARSARGWTQADLASKSELDVKTIRKAEQSLRIDLPTLAQVAKTLEVELRTLFVPDSADATGSEEAERAEHLREIILQWNDHWDANDADALMELFTEDAVMKLAGAPDVPFGGIHRGKLEIREVHERTWKTFRYESTRPEDLTFHVTDNSVAVQGAKGVYLPNGELAHFPSLQIFTFRGDLIAHYEVQFDTLEFVKRMQLM